MTLHLDVPKAKSAELADRLNRDPENYVVSALPTSTGVDLRLSLFAFEKDPSEVISQLRETDLLVRSADRWLATKGVHLPWMEKSEKTLALEKAAEKAKLPKLAKETGDSGAKCPHCKTVPTGWRALSGGIVICGNCKRSSKATELSAPPSRLTADARRREPPKAGGRKSAAKRASARAR